MLNIKSIHSYGDNSLEIIEDYDPERFDNLSADLKDAIIHIDDYEPIAFFVINQNTQDIVILVDSISDQVFAEMPVEEFITKTIETAEEWMEEYSDD